MKKVKLLGALACASMLLAGCNGGNGNTSSAPEGSTSAPSTSETSTSVVPAKQDWTEEEFDTIEEFLSDEDHDVGLPFGYGMVMEQVTDDTEYLKFVGDKVTEKELAAYGELLCNEQYGFLEKDFLPEDIGVLESWVDDSVVAYELDLSDGYWYPSYLVTVAIGQQAKTQKMQMIATYTACGSSSAFMENNLVYTQVTTAQVTQIMQYDFVLNAMFNDYPGAEAIETQAQYNAFKEEVLGNFVDPAIANPSELGVEDYQYVYPFSNGNAHSSAYFHAVSEMYIFGATQEEVAAYKDALVAAGYALVEGSEWEYEKVTEKGTFTLGAYYGAGGEGEEAFTFMQTCLDYKAPEVSE